jgi:hypothetical protein
MPECTHSEIVKTSEHDFLTTIQTFKFPMVSERLVINTEYPIIDFKHNCHVFISSGLGNETLYNAEVVGENRYRNSVDTVNDLSFY